MRRFSITALAAVMLLWLIPVQALGAPAEKTLLCHVTGDGGFVVIEVADKALPAHEAHGDLVVGEEVNENCEPLNTPPVAYDGEELSGWLPDWVFDADGDEILWVWIFNENPEGNDRWYLEAADYDRSFAAGCAPTVSPTSTFQWYAFDGQDESNVATMTVPCRRLVP